MRAAFDRHVERRVIAVPHRPLGIDVDAMRQQPANGGQISLADRKVQGNGVAAVRADARGIVPQHCLGLVVAARFTAVRKSSLAPAAKRAADDRRVGALLRRRRQRGCAGRIACIRVGAELEQELHDPRPVFRRRMVQRRAAMLVAGHPRRQQRRVSGDHGAQLIGSIERDRRPQIERRPVVEQIGCDILPHLLKQVAQPRTPTA